jgi:hypothetical protein
MSVPILGKKPDSLQEMQIRLLLCNDCHTIEELPDFNGHPDDDTLLKISVEKHVWPTGTEHLGSMMRVPLKFWGNDVVRKQIIAQIKVGVGNVEGLDAIQEGWYASKSEFQASAMTCYQKHNRPRGSCGDWKSDSKKLIPKTSVERKEAGMGKAGANGAPVTFTCDFCPVATYYHTRARDAKGLYT